MPEIGRIFCVDEEAITVGAAMGKRISHSKEIVLVTRANEASDATHVEPQSKLIVSPTI